MRLVIDLQSLFSPTTARRGIGFYSMQLALALARVAREHEVHLLLCDTGDAQATVAVRQAFRGVVGHERVHIHVPVLAAPLRPVDRPAAARVNEALREALLLSLDPDVVLVTSLFELTADCPTSVNRWMGSVPTAVVLYDLMPLEEPDVLLADAGVRAAYERKLEDLQRASLLLAISEHTASQASALLPDCPPTVTVYGAPIPPDSPAPGCPPAALLGRKAVLCVGGDHHRKNMDGLVQAWARVPKRSRAGRALVLACEVSAATERRLHGVARDEGLEPDEVLIVGYVSDADLAWLYDHAELFVFPSFSEGLGLPALEAMQHGCAVLVSDTTSLRELVLDRSARFDPADPADMASCITRALTKPDVLRALRAAAVERAQFFTWEQTAGRSWAALEQLAADRPLAAPVARRRLAVVSPWPPVRSGVADYALETTRALAMHYDVTTVGDVPVQDGLPWMTRGRFAAEWHRFDRVLYHFGNSPYHVEDMALLPSAPGVVLLHDSTVAGTLKWTDQALGHAHGVEGLLRESSRYGGPASGTDQRGLRAALSGAIGVQVHSQHAAAEVARAGFSHAPLRVVPHPVLGAEATCDSPELPEGKLVVGHFGFVHAFKMPELLITAAAQAQRQLDQALQIAFVGEVSDATYQVSLQRLADRLGVEVHFTGYVSAAELSVWTGRVACAVQLRSTSHGESSGSVTRLLAAGRPTIVSDVGSFADIPRNVVLHHPSGAGADGLARAIVTSLDPASGPALGERAAGYARESLALSSWAQATSETLERSYRSHPATCGGAALRAAVEGASAAVRNATVSSLVATASRRSPAPRIWASDVSTLSVTPFLTGIQRVTLSLHRELATLLDRRGAALVAADVAPPVVLADPHPDIRRDAVLSGIEVTLDDCAWLLCLDLDFGLCRAEAALIDAKARGTRVLVNVYDMLIVTNPEWFVPRAAESVFVPWLHTVVRVADVITVNSAATAAVLEAWISEHRPDRSDIIRIHVLPLGVDVPAAVAGRARPQPGKAPHVLMVGTIEPRKGHDDALDAFDLLWEDGTDARLTVVGRQGWMVEELVRRLERHPEMGQRLNWIQGADDEALEELMGQADAILVTSRGEGFGLPVVEAAARGLPLIVRDIPVLREVAGDRATYFAGGGRALAAALTSWMAEKPRTHQPAAARPLSWREVAQRLVEVIESEG